MPDLSLIIVNYKQAGLTRECIKNLKAHACKFSLEIIVADNSNDSELKELLELRYPDVRYIPLQRNAGFAAGNNRGIEVAQGRYIALINYDIIPLPGALDALIEYMDSSPEVGVAGPRLHSPDGGVQQSCYHFPSLLTPVYRRLFLGKLPFGKRHLEHYLMSDDDMSQSKDVDWLQGSFLIVRRSALEDVGLLDENFFMYLEDTDWCRRFWCHGWKVRYIPAVRMLHLHLRDSAHTMGIAALKNPLTRIHVYSALKYFIKQMRGGYRQSYVTTKEKNEHTK
ncbi:MAG: glycosyltransferase family 2 protein [Candidatus Uhrbacteria bacterium]|nr:glycosyltransferase family 2 protein [Candidatus Uhrbacteria bacterium]